MMDRIDKVNQMMKKEVSDIIHRELKDPRLEFVTITHANVSRDLQHARIFFSVLGNPSKVDSVQKGLNSARGYVRRLIGQRIRMRYTPEIEFVYDKSIEYSARIEETLERLKEESEERSQDQ